VGQAGQEAIDAHRETRHRYEADVTYLTTELTGKQNSVARAAGHARLAYVLGFVIAVGPVSVDMYLPAFAQISQRFGSAVPQLTLASYFAGLSIGQLIQGLLADRFGRRASLAAGLGLYTLASLACAAAQTGFEFCTFRALAAFGAAASIVVPRAMVRDIADGKEAASLMSDVLLIMSVAPVVAPVLGGLLLHIAGWRVIFFAAALYGIVCLYLLGRYIPETLAPDRRSSLAFGKAAHSYGMALRDPRFLVYAAIGAFGMAALFAYLAGAPTVFMTQYRVSPSAFATLLAALGVLMIGFFRVNRWLVRRRGVSFALSVGIAGWLLSGLALSALAWTGTSAAWAIFAALVIFVFGYSFIPSNSQVGALSRHSEHAGTATSLMSTLQYGAGALASALTGALADGSARPMAAIILACACGAAVAAYLRTPVEAQA
jgi:DHA1 family bicyclomycin/chloramphenicol resistance-like MFS transporter